MSAANFRMSRNVLQGEHIYHVATVTLCSASEGALEGLPQMQEELGYFLL